MILILDRSCISANEHGLTHMGLPNNPLYKISYHESSGEIIKYEDFQGNWYDASIMSFPPPYKIKATYYHPKAHFLIRNPRRRDAKPSVVFSVPRDVLYQRDGNRTQIGWGLYKNFRTTIHIFIEGMLLVVDNSYIEVKEDKDSNQYVTFSIDLERAKRAQ